MGIRNPGKRHDSSSIEKRTEKNSGTHTLRPPTRPHIHQVQCRTPGPAFSRWSGSYRIGNVG
jgi:hypothetical protein